jgi:hypothetical protein
MRWWSATGLFTGSAASASQMGRFETKWLSRPENLAALADCPVDGLARCAGGERRRALCATWIRARARPMASRRAVPMMAISAVCYQPLFVFNQFGDVERCVLRSAAMRGQREQRWQGMRGEVCPGTGRAARFSASARSTGGSGRLLPTRCAICRCPRHPKERSWPHPGFEVRCWPGNHRESGECRIRPYL